MSGYQNAFKRLYAIDNFKVENMREGRKTKHTMNKTLKYHE